MDKNLITPDQLYIYWNGNGIRMGKQTVYRLIKRKDFPSVKFGGRYYIISDDIDSWVSKQIPKCCA